MSIVYMALENIVSPRLTRRWLITFAFGLVHGFGFSFALRETLQFAGSHLLTSLLSFNVGVELGQLLVLAVLVPALDLLFRYVVAERMGTIILSAIVAHTAWHWMIERGERLRQYPFSWPALTPAFLASAMRWLMLAVIVAAAVWAFRLANVRSRRRSLREQRSLDELVSEPPLAQCAGIVLNKRGWLRSRTCPQMRAADAASPCEPKTEAAHNASDRNLVRHASPVYRRQP